MLRQIGDGGNLLFQVVAQCDPQAIFLSSKRLMPSVRAKAAPDFSHSALLPQGGAQRMLGSHEGFNFG